MASLSKDKNGTKRIMFMDQAGKRRTIRLGKINVKAAESFLMRVGRFIAASSTGTPIDTQTIQWLAELPDDTYTKLVNAGGAYGSLALGRILRHDECQGIDSNPVRASTPAAPRALWFRTVDQFHNPARR